MIFTRLMLHRSSPTLLLESLFHYGRLHNMTTSYDLPTLREVLTDSEAAMLRAACEIAVDFWQAEHDKTETIEDADQRENLSRLCLQQRRGHKVMLERIQHECGV